MPLLETRGSGSALGFGLNSFKQESGDFESIMTVIPSSTNVINFTSIPQTYKHLHIRGVGRTGNGGKTGYLNLRFNNDTGNNYHYAYMERNPAADVINTGQLDNISQIYTSYISGGNSISNCDGVILIDIFDYTSANKFKSVFTLGSPGMSDVDSKGLSIMGTMWKNSSSPITSIQLTTDSGNFGGATKFALYGIKG